MSVQLAHVSYVLPPAEQMAAKGSDVEFLLSPFQQVTNIVLLGLAVAILVAAYVIEKKVPWVVEKIKYFRGRSRTYQEIIPLMLRVAIGLALIGAGSGGYFISPAVDGNTLVNFAQVLAGFLLVSGFLVTPASFFALALSITALVGYPTLLGNLELLAAIVAFILLGVTKPGLDDLLGLPHFTVPEKFKLYVPLIIRLGLGGALVTMALYEKFLNPHMFAAVAEHHIVRYIPLSPEMWTLSVGLTELVVGLAIVVGLRTRSISALTFLILSVTFFVFKEDVFAHITLFATLAALMLMGGGAFSLDNWYAKRKNAA